MKSGGLCLNGHFPPPRQVPDKVRSEHRNDKLPTFVQVLAQLSYVLSKSYMYIPGKLNREIIQLSDWTTTLFTMNTSACL